MPYNIWCGGCGNHIGMGVRYNAEKKKVGNYYTTPIYRFRMKCHLCDNYIEIETDPKNCDYTIVAGARRKEERWDPAAAENVIATDHAEKQKLIDDAMFKLEHGDKDKRKSKAAIPGLVQIKDMQTQWKDDFSLNQMLRKKFRQEKKVILEREERDQEIKDKGSLDLDLVNEDPDDIRLAKNIRFRAGGYEEEKRKRRLQIKSRPMFSETPDKNNHRASLLEKRQRMVLPSAANALTTIFTKNSEDVGIRRKSSDDLKKKECSANDAEKTPDRTIGEKLTNNCLSKTNFERAPSESECRKNKYSELKNGLHEEKKINDLTNSTCKKEISKPEEHDKLPKCDVQQNVNSEGFIKNDQLFTSTCDQKANKHKQVSSNETSNAGSTNTVLNEDDYQSKKPKISLVSQLYSDTDSDSSK